MLKTLKHLLLKLIDLTALGFLEPIVRLLSGEEPGVQVRKIARFVVVPVIVFLVFLGLWAVVAPKHKTKSGEVPTPVVVYDAYRSIMTFHERENAKEATYLLQGDARQAQQQAALDRLEALKPLRAQADQAVADAQASHQAYLAEYQVPLRQAYEAQRDQYRAQDKADQQALKTQAASIAAGDAQARQAYRLKVIQAIEAKKERSEALKALRAQSDAMLRERFAPLVAAQLQQTEIAEEQQFLRKIVELASDASREVKTAAAQAAIARADANLADATGDALWTGVKKQIRAQERLDATATSSFAKPWTLPMQVARSIFCVFVGFLIGTAIAVPIGVLCGLSSTFMAAMTPFIALFKPVSPIVWLPIALIIVGGFIEDPDKHWLMQWLGNLPWIGWMEINPAFIASAVTVALCSLWATMVNTALGVASVDKDHLNVARVLRLGFWSRLFKIILPSSLPLIFAGLRISLGVGWMVLIAAELLSSSEGIGKFVWDQFNNGASDSLAKMFVVVFVVGFIGLLLDRMMIIFQRLVSFEGSVAAI